MVLEIRKHVAEYLDTEITEVGVIRGDNVTMIVLSPKVWEDGYTNSGQGEALRESLSTKFGPSFIHLGIVEIC